MKKIITESIELTEIFDERAKDGHFPMVEFRPNDFVRKIRIKQVGNFLDGRKTLVLEIERLEDVPLKKSPTK